MRPLLVVHALEVVADQPSGNNIATDPQPYRLRRAGRAGFRVCRPVQRPTCPR
jgi:hypothetical protein